KPRRRCASLASARGPTQSSHSEPWLRRRPRLDQQGVCERFRELAGARADAWFATHAIVSSLA
ncbi:MAG TPA: hypothetical protein VGG41_04775, partial [Solirubrobacteraceae bacterium]